MGLSIATQMCSILAMQLSRIQEHFAMLDDPRIDRIKRHELVDIVVIAILVVICGSDGWDDIVDFAAVQG